MSFEFDYYPVYLLQYSSKQIIMKKSIKNLEGKEIKNVQAVKGGGIGRGARNSLAFPQKTGKQGRFYTIHQL